MTPSAALAHVLVDELIRCGVEHVVLCPGSRSAPLAYALLAADRAARLTLHVRVDERSAAFLALGVGAACGRPAAVVTTSGTAVANLHPAVLEAAEAGVALLVVSADRPPELRGTRANQTTEHLPILAGSVRWSHDVGAPDAEPTWPARMPAWRTAVDRAVAAATGAPTGDPGPAHLNVPLRDPLAPDALSAHEGRDGPGPLPPDLAGRPGGRPWTTVVPATPNLRAWQPPSATTDGRIPAPPASTTWLLDLPDDEPATLLVLGDAPDLLAAAAVASARRRGWPVVAEPFGPGGRQGVAPHGPLVLATPGLLADHPPRRIVVVGHLTLTRDLAALLRTPGARVVAVTDRPVWPDPGHVVTEVVAPRFVAESRCHVDLPAHDAVTADAEENGVGADEPDPGRESPGGPRTEGRSPFAAAWDRAAARTAELVPAALASAWPSGPSVADVVLRTLPEGATLFVGSSNAARDVDLARTAAGPRVVGNRGLAGIDGNVSTAAGHALARPGVPTYALVGDLTFVHDTNALVSGPGEPRVDLTVVVVDDDGGGIFGTLEYGEDARLRADRAGFERVFGTPTGTRIADLCAAHGVPHEAVRTPEALAAALATAPHGLRVVTVRVARDGHRALRDHLRRVVAG